MDRGRFSLLLLDPGEIYFEDFSAVFIPSDATTKTYDRKKQDGRLKMCSKSLVFEPKDISQPLIRLPLKHCTVIEEWKGSTSFVRSLNVLHVICKEYVEMMKGNIVAPYAFKQDAKFLFSLNFANIDDCLSQIQQLHRASTLPAAEQADMIATIVHSRQARFHFDPLWLDLYEKVLMEVQADKVTPLAVNPGRVLLSTARLFFQPYNNIETHPVLKINLNSIKSIVKRRFLLRHIGLEIHCNENSDVTYIYLALRSPKDRDALYTSLLEQPEVKLQKLEQDIMTLQWQNGVVSNFEYLLYVNSLGDRTTNDLTQYPVFPWILTDYKSPNLDLTDPNIYRDLSKPIGALNDTRLERLEERYEEMSHPKFLYGSHYSTPGFVLYYLVRLYPHYMLCLQGGRFDHPDRMFNSVADAFKNVMNNMSDFKELTPEFYDVEQEGKFLVNDRGVNYGYRHNGLKVGDVALPPWAESPRDFVRKLRDALESDYVSERLHGWIDLIFGYKQKGVEAENAKNLFYYLCYEGNVDLNSITDLNERHALEVQIMEFGQIPKQVFKVPHPRRKVGLKMLPEPDQIDASPPSDVDSWKSASGLTLKATFRTHKNTVSWLIVNEDSSKVISVGHDSKLKIFSLISNRQIRSANISNMPLSSCYQLPNKNVLVVGSWDNAITFYDLDLGRVVDSIYGHEDAVTCMAWGEKAELLVSGSGDCTAKVWKSLNKPECVNYGIHCLKGQLDHNSNITCLNFDPSNTSLAVGTRDGEIYIWDMETFNLRRKFQPHTSNVTSVSYGPDGTTLASCGFDCLFQIMDVNTGMVVFSNISPSPIHCLKWKNDVIGIGIEDGTVALWDVVAVKILLQMNVHKGAVTCLDFSPDNKLLVTGSEDHSINVWEKV